MLRKIRLTSSFLMPHESPFVDATKALVNYAVVLDLNMTSRLSVEASKISWLNLCCLNIYKSGRELAL